METEKLLQLCEATAILKQLEARGYIEMKEKEVIFTEKSEELLRNSQNNKIIKVSSKDLEELVNNYRELFPKGITSGGYAVRGDKRTCMKKMSSFLKTYPEYPKELIIEATKSYINRKELEGFRYMQLAHYFITKDGVSNLAGECDLILDRNENSDRIDPFQEEM